MGSQAAVSRTAYVGLGSNLGVPERQLESALAELGALPDTRVAAVSSFYLSAPVDAADQPDYVNAVARLETGLAPRELLAAMLEVEQRHGRVRARSNQARTLDLDLLLYGSEVMHEPRLTLPHPRMHARAFVLRPLLELDPAIVIPGQGRAAELAARLTEQRIRKLEHAA